MIAAMRGTSFAYAASATMNGVAGPLFRLSGGHVRVGQIGLIELTTTGRRSGEPRTVLLTHYSRTPGEYVVVGTNSASSRQPAWYHNLSADPEVIVAADGRRRPMRAHIIDGAERRTLLRTYALRGYGIPALVISRALAPTRVVPLVALRNP